MIRVLVGVWVRVRVTVSVRVESTFCRTGEVDEVAGFFRRNRNAFRRAFDTNQIFHLVNVGYFVSIFFKKKQYPGGEFVNMKPPNFYWIVEFNREI